MEKIEIFEEKILRVHNVFSLLCFKQIQTITRKLTYKKKSSPLYSCSCIRIQEAPYRKLYKLLETYIKQSGIEACISDQIGETVTLSGISEIVQIEKDDFLSTHIDDYNIYQAVIHIYCPGIEEGGELYVKDHVITPRENSLIMFPGKTPHSVHIYTGEIPRISLSLGFINI